LAGVTIGQSRNLHGLDKLSDAANVAFDCHSLTLKEIREAALVGGLVRTVDPAVDHVHRNPRYVEPFLSGKIELREFDGRGDLAQQT